MKLALSRIHYPISTLGPGERIGIWFQGCSIQCIGCISGDTWKTRQGDTTVSEIVQSLTSWLDDCDGVTISGGEPFDQPEQLLQLLLALRAHNRPINVLVYSGYSYEQLQQHKHFKLKLIDALISDPYLKDADQTKALRGSDNQRLHCLTELGQRTFTEYERPLLDSEKSLDIMFDTNATVWLAGIPRRGDMQKLATLLRADGHRLHTSEVP